MTAGGRAITLIELLIVLAIALAIGAVSLRSALTWSDEEQLAAVQSGLSSAALEARSVSLAEQRPVELVAEVTARGAFRVGTLTPVESVAAAESELALEVAPAMDDRLSVLYELPVDMSIEDDAGESMDDAGLLDSERGRIALMTLLPDGSARLSGSSWALVREEQRYLPSIETWTARLAFTPEESEANEDGFLSAASDEPVDEEGGEP